MKRRMLFSGNESADAEPETQHNAEPATISDNIILGEE